MAYSKKILKVKLLTSIPIIAIIMKIDTYLNIIYQKLLLIIFYALTSKFGS